MSEERRGVRRLDDGVLGTHGSQGGSHDGRLVNRLTTALRPHPIYRELCAPIAVTRVSRVVQQAGTMREPLSITISLQRPV